MKTASQKRTLILYVLLVLFLLGTLGCEQPVSGQTEPPDIILPQQPVDNNDDTIDPQEDIPRYLTFEGTVKEISKDHISNAPLSVFLENTNQEAWFVITDLTYMGGIGEISEGDSLTALYRSDIPVIMIYPPQYQVTALLRTGDEMPSFTAGTFHESLMNGVEELKLNADENTEIVLWDNTVFPRDIYGKDLLVFYSFTTRSIPAQTSPEKIVILPDDPIGLGSGRIELQGIRINGTLIEGLGAYIEEEAVMADLLPVLDFIGISYAFGSDTELSVEGGFRLVDKEAEIQHPRNPLLLARPVGVCSGQAVVSMEFLEILLNGYRVFVENDYLIIMD